MRNTIRKLTAVGLFLTTMAGATSALAEQAGAPIWKAYLQSNHLLPVAPRAVATSKAAASAALWNSYLPTGPVGSPQVSAYSEAQVRSRIPWYAQVLATTGSQSRTLAGLGR